ncbi:MAG: hypothetical protein UET83_11040, partial [Eubacteriales bacterium]|nr:hypothetical protein [Eubacteriales bacterium]
LKLRRFAEILSPDFVAIFCNTSVLLQNRASSVRKIYSQIALVQLCGITLVRKTVLKRDEKRVSCRRILRSAAHLLQ